MCWLWVTMTGGRVLQPCGILGNLGSHNLCTDPQATAGRFVFPRMAHFRCGPRQPWGHGTMHCPTEAKPPSPRAPSSEHSCNEVLPRAPREMSCGRPGILECEGGLVAQGHYVLSKVLKSPFICFRFYSFVSVSCGRRLKCHTALVCTSHDLMPPPPPIAEGSKVRGQ